jgi:hypothetical protein
MGMDDMANTVSGVPLVHRDPLFCRFWGMGRVPCSCICMSATPAILLKKKKKNKE